MKYIALVPALLAPPLLFGQAAKPTGLTDRYCVGCHTDKARSGGFSLSQLDLAHPERNAAVAEKVILKVLTGLMPPAGQPRP